MKLEGNENYDRQHLHCADSRFEYQVSSLRKNCIKNAKRVSGKN